MTVFIHSFIFVQVNLTFNVYNAALVVLDLDSTIEGPRIRNLVLPLHQACLVAQEASGFTEVFIDEDRPFSN